MSAKSKETNPAVRRQHRSAAGLNNGTARGRGRFPEWRQRVDCSKGMSILGAIALMLMLSGCGGDGRQDCSAASTASAPACANGQCKAVK